MQWENEWGGEILFSHGSPNSCGRAILIRNNTNYSVLSTTRDLLGRFITLEFQIDGKAYVLVNIYVPNKDKDLIQFFRKLHDLLQMEDLDSEKNIILGGDFNCPLNPALDKHGGGGLKNNQYLVLKGAFCLRKGYSNPINSYAKDRLHLLFVTYSGTQCQGYKSHIIYVFVER